jgi:hypothetical protein
MIDDLIIATARIDPRVVVDAAPNATVAPGRHLQGGRDARARLLLRAAASSQFVSLVISSTFLPSSLVARCGRTVGERRLAVV